MNTINTLKAVGQDKLVEACNAESTRFALLAERGRKGEQGIRVDECDEYSLIYSLISTGLSGGLDNIDKMSRRFINELWDLCIEEELVAYPEEGEQTAN